MYEGLSLVPEHRRYGPAILAAFKVPRVSGQPLNLPSAPEPVTITELRPLPLSVLESIATTMDQIVPLTGGADGLAQLSAGDFIGEEFDPLDSDDAGAQGRGLRTLEDVREAAIVAVPDIHIQPKPRRVQPAAALHPRSVPAAQGAAACQPAGAVGGRLPPVFPEGAIYQVQAALIQHCEKLRDRLALLDPPFSAARDDKLGVGAVRAWRSRFDSKYAAFYYPWLRVVDPLRSPISLMREIPPSGHVAGQYAQNDCQFGVHKAPANAPLLWAEDVTVFVDDAVHGILNPAGINAIRPLPGRGLRVFGAHHDSDTDWPRQRPPPDDDDRKSDQVAINGRCSNRIRFLPVQAQPDVDEFLLSLWQRGADGAIGGPGFCQMRRRQQSAAGREQGRLVAMIGVAPSVRSIYYSAGRAGAQSVRDQ